MADSRSSLASIQHHALPLNGTSGDYDALLAKAASRRFILLGEASHGTHDFYTARAEITRRMIEEQGIDAVVVEGDWPDVYRINRFVRGLGGDASAREALRDFERFPLWMWRNTVMESFIQWLHEWNSQRPSEQQTGVYGMDLYSMYRSADAVVCYLDQVDPEAAGRARERYACMNHHGDPQRYGYTAAMGISESCQHKAVEQVLEMMQARSQWLQKNGILAEDEQFYAERNAHVVQHAEAYYRGMFSTRVNTWNLRDEHMMDTLLALRRHIERQRGRPARIAVWAHNSHLGDARATESVQRGELNVGQLMREKTAGEALLVGFTTYTGHVTAAQEWGDTADHRWVRPALEGSAEALFHQSGLDRFYLDMSPLHGDILREPLLERAIGVIYRPETERLSHYFYVDIRDQFDVLFHLDETTALEPLDLTEGWDQQEPPETWPFGI